MDGWDFKSYVLGTLFYCFISEDLIAYINRGERAAGSEDFDYEKLPDAQAEFGCEETVVEKGFFVLPSELFGDVYEYLMQMYASAAGKSGGEYFTPQEVSEVLARIAVVGKKRVNKVYDPAVGSGSLLLKFAKVLGKENVGGFFGQEINLTTYNLARINMFLHDINYEKFSLAHGDTLLAPQHWDEEPFEAIVSKRWTKALI